MVYVSTAYANCGILDIEEKVYSLSQKASDIIKKVNQIEDHSGAEPDAHTVATLMEGRPNAYTFSKAIAENLVAENYSHLPVAIVRPSIVTPSLREPAPGIFIIIDFN